MGNVLLYVHYLRIMTEAQLVANVLGMLSGVLALFRLLLRVLEELPFGKKDKRRTQAFIQALVSTVNAGKLQVSSNTVTQDVRSVQEHNTTATAIASANGSSPDKHVGIRQRNGSIHSSSSSSKLKGQLYARVETDPGRVVDVASPMASAMAAPGMGTQQARSSDGMTQTVPRPSQLHGIAYHHGIQLVPYAGNKGGPGSTASTTVSLQHEQCTPVKSRYEEQLDQEHLSMIIQEILAHVHDPPSSTTKSTSSRYSRSRSSPSNLRDSPDLP